MAEKETAHPVAWDPFRELDLFRRWPLRDFSGLGGALEATPGRWAPSVDVSEDDAQYVVTAELPGAKKDDVSVELHENLLTIRGEKRNEREEKNEQRRYVERTYGSFSRSFTLPSNADADRIKASFEDGVLTIEIAKREELKPKNIVVG